MSQTETPEPVLPEMMEQIIRWARQAGQIALRYFKHATPRLKPDQSFVTEADLEIEHYLIQQLQAAFPEYHVISEESQAGKIDRAKPMWAIDPLDGTTAFSQGLPGWGISIGLLEHGQPRFGLFYMPLLDDLTYTTRAGLRYENKYRWQRTLQSTWGAKGFLAVGASVHCDFQIKVERMRAMGSIGASLVYTARGAATAALVPKACLWDLVAGAAILNQAGGQLRYLSGQNLDYGALVDGRLAPEPIIAGHPDLLAELPRKIRLLGRVRQFSHLSGYDNEFED
jgi:myo-inositol-1(or 4)-monophosphatase